MDKWLVAGFYDKTPPINAITQELTKDINLYKKHTSKLNPQKPYNPQVSCELRNWINVNALIPSDHQPKIWTNGEANRFVDNNVVARLRREFNRADQDYAHMAVLLDIELFNSKNAADIAEIIVNHPYFRPDRDTIPYVCCFWGTMAINRAIPSANGRDCKQVRCSSCPQIKTCKHTCYWRLIGTMLGAYPEPYPSKNRPVDTGVLNSLPPTYIY